MDRNDAEPVRPVEIKDVGVDDISAVAAARALFREYERSLGVDLCFQQFEAELAALPGEYAPPRGRLLLAVRDQQAVGCIALRELHRDVGELKRLYVQPKSRRQGIGLELMRRLLGEARVLGYRRIRLDTLPSMHEAQKLYQSFGFHQIPPYRSNPILGALWMELHLRPGAEPMSTNEPSLTVFMPK